MSQNLNTNRFSDSPEFDSLLSSLSHLLFEINGDISTLQQFLETLESGIANDKSIEKITAKSISNIGNTTTKMIELKNIMDKLVKIDNSQLNNQRIISKDKILRDVNFSVKEFKICQQRLGIFNEKLNNQNKAALMQEEESLVAEQQNTNNNSASVSGNHNKMQMIIERHDPNQLELEYKTNMIKQRDQEISQIQSGIQDINSIFKDLSNLVVEQGQMLDTIESNIYNVETNVRMGSQELSKALEYQRRKSKLCFYLFFFLFMILLFTILFTF